MRQTELLDEAAAVTGGDAQTARLIGVAKQSLWNARQRGSVLNDELNGQIAEMLGRNPWTTICRVKAAHAKSEKKQKLWRRWAGAAAICLGVWMSAFISFPSTAYAASTSASDIHYAQYPMQLVPRTLKTILQQLRGFLCGVLPRFFEMFGCVRVL